MIKYRGCFSKNELVFVDTLSDCFVNLFLADGTVEKIGKYVRYEIYIGHSGKRSLLILLFYMRDTEDSASGFGNYIHISNILVPSRYRRQGIATRILFIMPYITTRDVHMNLYVTGSLNDSWKESLVSAGGIIDDDGDIQIFYEPFLDYFQDKLICPIRLI